MPVQPDAMLNDFGVILSIGFFANGEAFEFVQPFASDSTTLSAIVLCQDAVQSWESNAQAQLLACLSSDTSLVFISAEAMVNGRVPYRDSFNIGDHPGTRAAVVVPTQAAALVTYYQDPDDVVPPGRIRIAKTFIAGISQTDQINNGITSALAINIGAYADAVQSGFPSTADSSSNWYRVLQVPSPRTAGAKILRTINYEVRTNIYTQKRRLVPRI